MSFQKMSSYKSKSGQDEKFEDFPIEIQDQAKIAFIKDRLGSDLNIKSPHDILKFAFVRRDEDPEFHKILTDENSWSEASAICIANMGINELLVNYSKLVTDIQSYIDSNHQKFKANFVGLKAQLYYITVFVHPSHYKRPPALLNNDAQRFLLAAFSKRSLTNQSDQEYLVFAKAIRYALKEKEELLKRVEIAKAQKIANAKHLLKQELGLNVDELVELKNDIDAGKILV